MPTAKPEASPQIFPARFRTVSGMQAGASRDHERVARRTFKAVYAQVDEASFDVDRGDFGVRIGPGGRGGSVLYSDVVLDRQGRQGRPDRRGAGRATATALVVIEILSPSTRFAHHSTRFERQEAVDGLLRQLVLD